MSHKGTFIATSAMFVMGLFLTVLISQKLDSSTNTSSFAQSPATPGLTCPQCDVNGDGIINQTDIDIIRAGTSSASSNPLALALLAYCPQFANPATPVTACPAPTAVPTVVPLSTPVPTRLPTRAPNGIGDCTGPVQVGQKDGITDLRDLEQFRVEFNKETQTIFCDFDKNSVVDIIDFTNFLRKGLVQ